MSKRRLETKHQEQGTRPLKDVKIMGLALGKLLSKRSFLAQDETSKNGLEQARDHLSQGETGLILFFAHLGLLDPFGTAAVIEKEVKDELKFVYPVAASWRQFPGLNRIFNQLQRQLKDEIIPVYRKEEFSDRFLDFSGLDADGKKQANQAYIQRTQEALKTPGEIVMVAPYGGRAPYAEHLRRGPMKLLQSGNPVLLSLTVWNWKKLKYEVHFSEVLKFDSNVSVDKAHSLIFSEYLRMAELSNVSQEEMLDSKSGSFLSKNLWKFLATTISVALLVQAHRKRKKKT